MQCLAIILYRNYVFLISCSSGFDKEIPSKSSFDAILKCLSRLLFSKTLPCTDVEFVIKHLRKDVRAIVLVDPRPQTFFCSCLYFILDNFDCGNFNCVPQLYCGTNGTKISSGHVFLMIYLFLVFSCFLSLQCAIYFNKNVSFSPKM